MPTDGGSLYADEMMRALSRAVRHATNSDHEVDIMDRAVAALVDTLGARYAELWWRDGRSLERMTSSDAAASSPSRAPVAPAELNAVVQSRASSQHNGASLDRSSWHWWGQHLSDAGIDVAVHPLILGEEAVGCVALAFDANQSHVYETTALFAENVTQAIETARLNRVAQRSAQQLEFQHRLLRRLADSRSVPTLVDILTEMSPHACSIVLVSFDDSERARVWVPGFQPKLVNAEVSKMLFDAADADRGQIYATPKLVAEFSEWGTTPHSTAITLVRAGRTRGMLVSYHGEHDGPAATEFLHSAAVATTIGLSNALSFEREFVQVQRLTTASALAAHMSTSPSQRELCERLAVGIQELFDASTVSVYGNNECGAVERAARVGEKPTSALELTLVDHPARRTRVVVDHHMTGYAIALHGRDGYIGTLCFEIDTRTTQMLDDTGIALLENVAEQASGTIAVIASSTRIESNYHETIQSLLMALEASDQYTADHASDVAVWAVDVGRRLGLDADQLRNIELGAIFHDIGKIAIPSEILNKPGKLTDAEFEIMKGHTIAGERIIAPIEFLQDVRPIVRHEHERWDGRGYPDGIEGESIPLGSRIIFVCDAYDAITTNRPYREARSDAVARSILVENAGSQFDPAVVSVFLDVLDDHFQRAAEATAAAKRDMQSRAHGAERATDADREAA